MLFVFQFWVWLILHYTTITNKNLFLLLTFKPSWKKYIKERITTTLNSYYYKNNNNNYKYQQGSMNINEDITIKTNAKQN